MEAFGKMGLGEDLFSEWNGSLDNPLENWEGIHVSKSPDGYELSIDFSGQPLNGTLCDELFRLPGLTYLSLSDCHFSGPIPESIGNLTCLEFLDVSENKLTGSVPEEVKGLSNYSNFIFNPQQAGYEITGAEAGDTDKAALLSIREAWGADAPQKIRDTWTDENVVTDFYGVTVNGLGQVTALDLSSLNISSLPDMSALTQLKTLDLNDNDLTESRPGSAI